MVLVTASGDKGQGMATRGGDHTAAHQAAILEIRQYLQWRRAWEFKVLGGMFQRTGVPDIIACLPPAGRFVAIEVKTGVGKATERQWEELCAIEEAGGVALVVANSEQLDLALLERGVVSARLNLSHQSPLARLEE